MATYISILRGINVSGHNRILMKDLAGLYESLGYAAIKTYIQSGNIIFNAREVSNEVEMAEIIEQAIRERYNYEVPVIIRTVTAMAAAVRKNPFLKLKGVDESKLHITFLSEKPASRLLDETNVLNYPPDEYSILGTEVFLHCPVNYGESKISNKFFESKLKVKATTRNWKTVNMLLDMAS